MAVPPQSQEQHQQRGQGPAERQQQQAAPMESDRSVAEIRALDCNLTALCEHIQVEGFTAGIFSDVIVQAMGTTYHLHRLILSRSSYFRGWSPTLNLNIDDDNVSSEAITMALAYLYGHYPKLNDRNAFRVLAVASYLDLQDLCGICTDFIISELWTSNFLAYQIFAESQDYGIHGERVRNACWGYLCQCGTMELREVLPRLSSQTLHALLTSDELWVSNEEKRFELALYTLLARDAFTEENSSELSHSACEPGLSMGDSSSLKGKKMDDGRTGKQLMESELQCMNLQDNALEGYQAGQNLLVDLSKCVMNYEANAPSSISTPVGQTLTSLTGLDPRYSCKVENVASLNNSFSCSDAISVSCSHTDIHNCAERSRISGDISLIEGPSDDNTHCQLADDIWLSREQSRNSSSVSTSCSGSTPDWGRSDVPPPWGERKIGQRHVKSIKGISAIQGEEYEAFSSIFEGGSLLYSHMSFEALLNVRKQLEELGFPCKTVNDGLWLQMLLSHRVQEIAADTCITCCLTITQCTCRQPYGYSHGCNSGGYYKQEHSRSNGPQTMGNVYITDAQGERNGLFGPVRVHVRGPIDGLAGIGRGTTFVPGAAWPPTRLVFSRVPLGVGNRNSHQSVANDESEARVDVTGDLTGDGLTALVGLSRGSNALPVHAEQSDEYETDLQRGLGAAPPFPTTSGISMQMMEPQENGLGIGWEDSDASSVSWDLKTALRHFPPFRFGVEFEDVHRLADGQVKHSPEAFYAGSLWKVSVQAFNNEYPQGRRTLGLFLHRRKAEATESLKKVHMYVDSREKVTARYQLICPSKREVMVFGSFKDSGTLLPKAPKGWGWRTALLFDELPDLLQGGALRVVAVVQLV
ncbi:unnamed protein product [Spirodela intermedia]|uniref:BTB domain-containing protein n=1 Tax=Spirodela intermedia TaxID=51605 RepID=A0A7I8IWA4_SPIIN|nr:unnamed protein product [Spirodela intermedia]CAA6662051.1 unnamed protein product [Spirodela intermedia]